MKGNSRIAEILQKEYNIKNLEPYENINYEVMHLSEEISRVKITSKTGDSFCCPVYAMFDGYHMSWYGDYGSWVFDCTWKTDVMNLAYGSPYYQLKKLNSRDRHEFNDDECKKRLLELIRDGNWYKYDLSDEQQSRFDEFITDYYACIDFEDDVLSEYIDLCDELQNLYESTEDEYSWISAVRKLNFDDLRSNVFSCEEYELYDIGKKAPGRFFIILYMLSVVANSEEERMKQLKSTTENTS